MKQIFLFVFITLISIQSTMSQTHNFVFDTLNGWLTIGTTISEVENMIGPADSVGHIETWHATGDSYQNYFYGKGLSVTYLLSDTEAKTYCIELIEDHRYRTSRGIHIGDKQQDVLKSYRSEIVGNPFESNMSIINNLYEGTYFFYQNGSVWKIVIGSIFE